MSAGSTDCQTFVTMQLTVRDFGRRASVSQEPRRGLLSSTSLLQQVRFVMKGGALVKDTFTH